MYSMDSKNRTLKLKAAIQKAFDDNQDLLDRLGSDYDDNGIPYWEKTGTVDPDYDPKTN